MREIVTTDAALPQEAPLDGNGRPLRLLNRGRLAPMWEFDPFEYEGARPLTPGVEPIPLDQYDYDDRFKIAYRVQGKNPPQRRCGGSRPWVGERAWYEWHWFRGIDPTQPTTRKTVNASQRRRILARDNETCGICGHKVSRRNFHVDHIVPVVLGDETVDDNLQVAHPWCNSWKGAA